MRRTTLLVLAMIIFVVPLLQGCGDASDPAGDAGEVELAPVRIGTLPTEDALPLWVAQDEGLFEQAGLEVEIITFQAAAERDAAFTAGEIDGFMGDILAAAALEAGGTSVTIATVMLGADETQGRFGIVAAPDSAYQDLTALAGVPVGTSSGTIQEYVLDGLMLAAGVPADQILTEEVKKVPVRFELLMNGQLEAAALPEPFLTLAEEQGAKLLADDTQGENLSQTVLVFADSYLAAPGGIEAMTELLDVWDSGAVIVNDDPEAWRELLVEQARLPEPIKDIYAIQTYPGHTLPSAEQVGAVLDWMTAKGLLDKALTYEDLVLVTP